MRYALRPGAINWVPGSVIALDHCADSPVVFMPTKLFAAQMYAGGVRERNPQMRVKRITPK